MRRPSGSPVRREGLRTRRGRIFRRHLCGALLVLTATAQGVDAQWVEPVGEGWAALAVFHQDTRSVYDLGGDSRDFFAEGHARTTSSFLTVASGLMPGIDAWAQFSFHRLDFDDLGGERSSTGLGDTRLWVRGAPLRLLGSAFPLTIRGGVKLPIGDFDVDAEVIPLGDGQRDWELMAEVGHSFYPRSVYIMGWIGYRWRELNTESRKDFGDEVFFFAQLGGAAGPIGYKVALDGWDGGPGVIEGLPVASAQRDLIQIQPSVLIPFGPGSLEAGARFTLRGRNLPAGTAFMFGYFADWSLP